MIIKVIIRKVCNLIQWQFRRRNYDNEFKEIHFDGLNALEKNSYFIYKNFLPISQTQKLKKKLQQYKKKNRSKEKNTVYFRSRTDVSIDNNFINIYVKNNYVKKILNNFYGSPTEIEKCTYELKKGLKKKENNLEVGEHQYHIDRGYGVLKFCLFLEDIDSRNGPFCIIPGSHKWPKNLRSFFHRLFHLFFEGYYDKIPDAKVNKYINVGLEKTLTGKAGDLLIVNTSAFHKATALEQNAKREVFWIYTKFPDLLSSIKKNLLFKKKVQ